MKTLTTQSVMSSAHQFTVVVVALCIAALSALWLPYAYADNNEGQHNGNVNKGQAYHRENNQGQNWNRGDHDDHHDRDDYRYKPGYAHPYYYSQPVYVPPPVYYEPYQSPGINLFFPLDLR
jgi:hypothetical protein